MNCSTMSRNLERSSSTSQHSVLARPITLNFSDDEYEIESNREEKCSTTFGSQRENGSSNKMSTNNIDSPDSSR